VGVQCRGRHIEEGLLGLVGVRHHATEEVAGGARHGGDGRRDQPAGARLGKGDGEAAPETDALKLLGERDEVAGHP